MTDVFKFFNLTLLFFILAINFSSQAKTNEIFFLGHFPLEGFVYDVTGYFDSLTSKEYAITGSTSGVWIIDVTDPQNPAQAAFIDAVPGFDLKVWKNYLYCVTGGGGEGQGKIVDISDPGNPEIKTSFYSSHNIFISDSGYLFAESPGLKIYNLNNDPLNPEIVWDSQTNDGHDATVIDNYVYDFRGTTGTNIYEIKYQPEFSMQLLSTINISLINYHHSGWITNDKKYLFICDEGALYPRPDITVWDISDPVNPDFVTQFSDSTAKIHNLYIKNNYAFTSYYSSGFRVFDISDPAEFKIAAEFDTNIPATGENFSGAFGCFPFTKSGNIYISDQSGLYVFKFAALTDVDENKNIPVDFELYQNYPNPFNPTTKIKFAIPPSPLFKRGDRGEFVSLKVYDVLGNEIATLVNEEKSPGVYEVEFSAGSVGNGKNLTSGIYFYNLKYGQQSQSKKLILMK